MTDETIERFYTTRQWRECRKAFAKSKGFLCERCLAKGLIVPGEEVHHKVHLTPETVDDPNVALSWDNLILLCRKCHQEEHHTRRWRCDPAGHVRL